MSRFPALLSGCLALLIGFAAVGSAASSDRCTLLTADILERQYGINDGEARLLLTSGITPDVARRYEVAARAFPYSMLAEAVDRDDEIVLGEWRRTRIEESDSSSGFHGAVFEHVISGEAVLAFAGTSSWPDLKTAVWGAVLPRLEKQNDQAVSLTGRALEKYPSLKVTGHSLGGRLAQIAAAAYGLEAYTFNAAAVSDLSVTELLRRYPAANPKGIVNLFIANDLVNSISKVFVLARDIGQDVDFEISVRWPFDLLDSHLIGNMAYHLEGIKRFYFDCIFSSSESKPNSIAIWDARDDVGMSDPPVPPFVNAHVCEGEGCIFAGVISIAGDAAAARKGYDPNEPVVFQIEKGEKLLLLDSVVLTNKFGITKITKPCVLNGWLRLNPGDHVYSVYYVGEDVVAFLVHGTRQEFDGFELNQRCGAKQMQPLKTEQWVRVLNSRGQQGWVEGSKVPNRSLFE